MCIIVFSQLLSFPQTLMYLCSSNLLPVRGALLQSTPPQAATGTPKLRRKNSTLEKILKHANDYMETIARTDPNGPQLQQAALTRHTLRLRQRDGVPEEEGTMLPAASSAPASPPISKPRIRKHPTDVDAIQGVTKQIALESAACVRYCWVTCWLTWGQS
jgi:hypothetical protein